VQLLNESLWNSIEQIRVRALSIQRLKETAGAQAQVRPGGPILHWAEISLNGDRIQRVTQKDSNPQWAVLDRESFENQYLEFIRRNLSISTLKTYGITALRIKQDPTIRNEWIALAFYVTPGPRVVLALVDPNEAFSTLSRLRDKRAYVIGNDGIVLTHSQPSYNGTDFSKTTVFTQGIAALLKAKDPRPSGGSYTTIDQIEAQAAYLHPAGLPWTVVMERPKSAEPTTFPNLTPIALAIIALATLSWWIIRARAKKPEPEIISTSGQVEAAVNTITSNAMIRETLPPVPVQPYITSRDAELQVQRFEEDIMVSRSPRAVAARLTETASHMCESPALYFRFDAVKGRAELECGAGFTEGQAPLSLGFAIDRASLRKIRDCSRSGKVASLASFHPLSQALLQRMGIAHFEAWAVTNSEASLLGVLVILHSGVQSNRHRDFLIRMMRTTGSLYENTQQQNTHPL
jgi:hypothetical protein